jgi:hypothetical protein
MARRRTLNAAKPNIRDRKRLARRCICVNVESREVTRRLQVKGWDRTHNVWVRPEVVKAYHVNGVPTPYIIDGQGKIVAAGNVDIPKFLLHLVHP